MNTIKIACQAAVTLPLATLEDFQGELKTITPEDLGKLKKEITTTGFAFPVYVWQQEGHNYIIGGHQRKRALEELQSEGWTVPELPCVLVQADSLTEAKRRVIQDVAQYGSITTKGLMEFATGVGLNLDDLETSFKLPEIDFDFLRKESEQLVQGEKREEDGSVFDRTHEQYTGSIIKQIVLFFKADEFPQTVQRANDKLEKYQLADYSALFLRLLDADDQRDQAPSQ